VSLCKFKGNSSKKTSIPQLQYLQIIENGEALVRMYGCVVVVGSDAQMREVRRREYGGEETDAFCVKKTRFCFSVTHVPFLCSFFLV
jgi:hypothetical protein